MLPIGYILNNSYKIQKHVASGGFGNTYSAISLNHNTIVAVKEFFMKGINEYDSNYNVIVSNFNNNTLFSSQKSKFLREAQTLACLNNSHIVRVFDSFLSNNTAYYVMEYLEGNTVSQLINSTHLPINESRATNILVQMLNALMEIHNKNILHLDIKPANIIINSRDEAKIIDFGASKVQFSSNETVATFTPSYAPIELQQQQLNNLGPWTDLYSLGATYYFMLTTKKPPLTSDILNYGENAFQFTSNISEKSRSLIKWMMQPAKDNRPQNVIMVFQYLETGIIPSHPIINDSTIFPQNNQHIENKTVYPMGNNSISPWGMSARRPSNNISDFNKKTNSNGCIWGIVFFIVFIGIAAFLLYHYGYIDKWFNQNDDIVVVSNDSIEDDKTKQQDDRVLYNLLLDLCNETYRDIDNAESEDEINTVLDSFNNELDRINKEYYDVTLSDEHSNILEKKIDSLDSLCNVKTKEIQEKDKELEDLLNQFDEDEEDDDIPEVDNKEDYYTDDSIDISEKSETVLDDNY